VEFKTIQVEKAGYSGIIYLNQPESRNALSVEMQEELTAVLEDWSREEAVRAIIITGRGSAFCAGGDLRAMGESRVIRGRKSMQDIQRLILTLRNLEKPTIAAVNGPAFGAGWSLIMTCDFVIASEKARFSFAFVNIGLVPDCGSIYLLPRVIGVQKAKELMMTGRVIDATKACDWGLVNKVVSSEQLLASALELAGEMAQGPPLALAMLKNIINRAQDIDFATLLEEEALAQDICLQTEDHSEGVRAFFEKRKAQFAGR